MRGANVPWRALSRPLDRAARAHVARTTRALLSWQSTLVGFPRLSRNARGPLPDATPFVTLYAGGRVVGCFGSSEGSPGERLSRAFLHALEDVRYGGVRPEDRARLSASVSYVRAVTERSLSELGDVVELGTHGIAGVLGDRVSALLLPAVARDEHTDVLGLVEVLRRKLGLTAFEFGSARFYTFETDTVVARQNQRTLRPDDPVEAAGAWLASRVDQDGRVCFGVDSRQRVDHPSGEFFHGRAAIAVQALAAHGGHRRKVLRGRRWLEAEIRSALRGQAIADWPVDDSAVAGSLALAVLAGVDVADELAEFAKRPGIENNPWHAAQVVAALGHRAPKPLLSACVASLRDEPWAPWTLIAARAVGDDAVVRRVADVVAKSIRRETPYAGGAGVTPIPETALTALAVEALAPLSSRTVRDAVRRARKFLLAAQFLGERIPVSLEPAAAHGAFPLSCIFEGLRSDVTGHALLALMARSPS